jgi:hypothetical protein
VNLRKLSVAGLIEQLGKGWPASAPEAALEFVERWNQAFRTSSLAGRCGDNVFRFVTDLGRIRLRGMEEVACLIAGGTEAEASQAIGEFLAREISPGRVPFILAMSEAVAELTRQVVTDGSALVLSSSEAGEIQETKEPDVLLKRHLWKQIPRRRLVAYSITLPAQGHMFFGRSAELERLRDSAHQSFAIAGPGRIGKTSLLRQYERALIRSRDPRAACRFAFSFHGCGTLHSDALARFVAMSIQPSSRGARVGLVELVPFLRYQHSRNDRCLELLIDEMDEVCGNPVAHHLVTAAAEGYCRLVMCGRGALLKALLADKAGFSGRVELLRLEPLDMGAVAQLLLEPLADLGFPVREPDIVAGRVFRLTGGHPHLVQFYGQQLADLAIRQKADTVTVDHVELLKWDFETAQFFLSPLLELKEPTARSIALELLRLRPERITPDLVREVASGQGSTLGHVDAVNLLNELVIGNFMAWQGGSYRLANESLCDYAAGLGFFDRAIENASGVVPEPVATEREGAQR